MEEVQATKDISPKDKGEIGSSRYSHTKRVSIRGIGEANSEVYIPGDIEQIFIVGKNEILRYIRGWRLVGLLVLTILVVVLLWTVPIALKSDIPSDSLNYARQYINFVNILIILSVTLFGADTLVGEFQNKTAYFVFPNPIRRESIFIGKYIASTLCAFAVIGTYYGLTAVSTLSSTHGVPIQLCQSFLLALVYVASGMAVAFLISALMRGTTGANIFTFFLFLIIFSIIDSILSVASIKPTASLTFAGGVLSNIMTSPYPVDKIITTGGGAGGNHGITMHQYYSSIGVGIAVMLIYLFVCGIAALFLFKRREAKD